MFEKEATQYALEWGEKTDGTYACCRDGFIAGAELGYTKANEWHKPGEKLPEECSLVLAYLFEEAEPTICEYVVSDQWECLPRRIVYCSNDQVRMWKEIVLPKEIGK